MSKYLNKSFFKLFFDSPSLSIKKYILYSLFDEHHYYVNNSDVKSKGLSHYIKEGYREGRCPHPLFDPVFYQHNLKQPIKKEPFKHYMAQKGKIVSPHILFDAIYYAKQLKKIPENQTLLEHFLNVGWKQNLSPTPYFDFDFYYKNYPDIKNSNINPLLHYLTHGENEGRKPIASFEPSAYTMPTKPVFWNKYAYYNRGKLTFYVSEKEEKSEFLNKSNLVSKLNNKLKQPLDKGYLKYKKIFNTFFDEEYYAEQNWDIVISPLNHYLKYGSKEGRCPNPLFDPTYYTQKYLTNETDTKDKFDLSNEPLVHYYSQPNDAFYSPHPLFDSKFYLSQLKKHNIAIPKDKTFLEHFLKDGWKHNISPTKYFDVEFYLEQCPEVKDQANPLIHYLTQGERSGLQPNKDFVSNSYNRPYAEQNKDNPVYVNDSKLAMAIKGELGLPPELISLENDLRLIANEKKPIVVVVTHEASRTGAPAIILKLAQQLKKYFNVNIISLSGYGGELEAEFKVLGPFYKFKNWCTPHTQPSNQNLMQEIGDILNIIKNVYPIGAIVNSAESRNIISHFKFRNISTIALIHEMAYFYPKETFKEISVNADFTIFPAQIVADLANGNDKFIPEKTAVRGQGLLKPEILKIDKAKAQVKLKKMLNLPDDAFIVLGCGSLNKRKAPELFIHTAIQTIQILRDEGILRRKTSVENIFDLNEKNFTEFATKLKSYSKKRVKTEKKEIHFVWLGGNTKTCSEDYYWIDQDIIMTGCEAYIHFVKSQPDAEKYFAGSDVFLMTSRADPFPCVIHEAMAAELPVVGFNNAGGFVEAVTKECGKIVNYADVKAAAECIVKWYTNPKIKEKLGENAKKRVTENYNYLDYTADIAKVLLEVSDRHSVNAKKTKWKLFKENLDIASENLNINKSNFEQRKKVIFTLPAWEISGVNTFVENLIIDLNKRGYNAYLLFTSNHALYTNRAFMPDIPYRFLGSDEIFPVRWQKFIDYMEAEGPCIFVPNYDYFASAICPALSNNISILGVLHSDDAEHYEHAYRLGLFWNQMVSVSKVIEKKMLEYNPRFEDMSSVIYYGIDAPLKREMPVKRETLSIVYTGRIVKVQKRILDFIEIVEQLEKTEIDYIFTFIGDGPDYWEFKNGMDEMAKRNNIKEDKIRILGRQPIEKVYEELAKAHVFALCSDFEGLPLSLLEALSFYCIPVVTDIESGITEVLEHDKNALISPIGNTAAFVKNLVTFNSLDKNERSKFAKNAFDVLGKHKLRQADMGEQYAIIIDKMFKELEDKTYKRPKPLNVTKDKNILLPPTFQKIPHGFDESGNVFF